MPTARFKLVFFAPRSDTDSILHNLFSKNPLHVGKIGNYEQCAFVTPGIGQFKPSATARPTLGSTGILEKVDEDRVEVLVVDQGERTELTNAIRVLKERRTRTRRLHTMSTDWRTCKGLPAASAATALSRGH